MTKAQQKGLFDDLDENKDGMFDNLEDSKNGLFSGIKKMISNAVIIYLSSFEDNLPLYPDLDLCSQV